MSDKLLVSNNNLELILSQIINDLKTKISNKDISLPYTQQLSKSTYIKVDGIGEMYLSNNGEYIQLGNINKILKDINEIIELFNIQEHTDEYWYNTGIKNMPTARRVFGCVLYNNKIYCIGGLTNSPTNIVEIYDITNNTWSTGAPMPTAKYAFGCIQYNNKIYCIGGNSSSTLNTVEIYDITNNTWTVGTPIPTVRYGLGCILYNNKIYCIGGNSGSTVLNTVDIYDITNNTWSTGAPMPTARYAFGSVLYNNKIYCIGGNNNSTGALNNVDIYDITNNTWSTGAPMPTAKYGFGCVLYDNKIYCIGGRNGTVLNTVDIYDITNNTWSIGKPMSTARYDFRSIYYDNKIYCLGGYNSSFINLNTVEIFYLSYKSYSIVLPDIIANKLSKIVSNGLGNKVFRNDGTYKEIVPVYNTMNNQQINDMMIRLNSFI